MPQPVRRWMPLAMGLGAAWNAVALPVLSRDINAQGSTLAAVGLGIVAGPFLVLVGEGLLRPADRALYRQYGVLAFLSPSFLLRAPLTLIPGVIARLMTGDDTPQASPPGTQPLGPGTARAFEPLTFARRPVEAGEVMFTVRPDGTVDTPATRAWGATHPGGAVRGHGTPPDAPPDAVIHNDAVLVRGVQVGRFERTPN